MGDLLVGLSGRVQFAEGHRGVGAWSAQICLLHTRSERSAFGWLLVHATPSCFLFSVFFSLLFYCLRFLSTKYSTQTMVLSNTPLHSNRTDHGLPPLKIAPSHQYLSTPCVDTPVMNDKFQRQPNHLGVLLYDNSRIYLFDIQWSSELIVMSLRLLLGYGQVYNKQNIFT